MSDRDDDLAVLSALFEKWGRDFYNVKDMTKEEIGIADSLLPSGLLFRSGGSPTSQYYIPLRGLIAINQPPKWWTEMSPREKATHEKAWERTVADYLQILHERPDVRFCEYDNTDVLFAMVKSGLIRWRTDRQSSHHSMNTTLWPELTDAGRAALEAKERQE